MTPRATYRSRPCPSSRRWRGSKGSWPWEIGRAARGSAWPSGRARRACGAQGRARPRARVRGVEGFKGFVALGDRQSGKVLGVAFWESEEALRATEQAVSDVRSGAAGAADGIVAGVERYEVLVNEAPAAGPLDAVTGTVGGVTDTVGGTTGTLVGGGAKKGERREGEKSRR